MHNLEKLIRLAKDKDENAMLEIIERFRPLINKYFKKSYYNEDVKSALELKLIEIVKLDFKFDNMRERNEGALVNYIVSSLYHHYIAILNKNSMKSESEMMCEDDFISNLLAPDELLPEINVEENALFESLRSILTEREYDCVYHIVFMGYTSEEISKYLHITKQACNQCKLRAFEKIRKFYGDS